MTILAHGLQSTLLFNHTSSLVSWEKHQHYPISIFNLGVRIISSWTKQFKTLIMVLTPSSLTSSKHQTWRHPLMRLILSLSQSPGFYAQLVPILIFLNCSLLLASNLTNYGAILQYSIISNGLKLRWLWLIIPLFRRRWMNY